MSQELTRTAAGGRAVIRAVLIDVGFTLTAYDAPRIAALAAKHDVQIPAAALVGAERAIRAELAHHAWPQQPDSRVPTTGGVRFIRRLLELAGAEATDGALNGAADGIWQSHLERNLWSRVLPGAEEALARLRAEGLRLAAVSNAEGNVDALLEETGLRPYLTTVLDSWLVGFAKPDPRIFALALDRLGVTGGEAVMVGDSPIADVEGAAAAGVRGALLDPFDLYPTAAAPRFPSFAGFVDAFLGGVFPGAPGTPTG